MIEHCRGGPLTTIVTLEFGNYPRTKERVAAMLLLTELADRLGRMPANVPLASEVTTCLEALRAEVMRDGEGKP